MSQLQHAPSIRLESHPTARDAAIARTTIRAGSIIASIPALSTSLLPSEKGRRCDECHRKETESLKLKRCSGCVSFWYCGTTCQNRAWAAHHKKICKNYSRFIVSEQYQPLTTHDQVDALLLTQLIADPGRWGERETPFDLRDPISTFMDLVKFPRPGGFVPPLCLSRNAQSEETMRLAANLYSRFGNNNFVLHSHLDSYAHGVFPLASRLFNHSCVPTAVCKYVITPSEPVRMDVVALCDISEGEEITIPYLDPALPYQTRQDALRTNYGFTCSCRLCVFQASIGSTPAPPPRFNTETSGGAESDPANAPVRVDPELARLDTALRAFSLGDVERESVRVPTTPGAFEKLPSTLYPALHETYLPGLSEAFSRAAHEGPYGDAVDAGLTLLALYVTLYPPNYPQIGMHALELAKTLWNLTCSEPNALGPGGDEQLHRHARAALAFAAAVLGNFGQEGDEGGPLDEVQVLSKLLDSQ